MWKGHKMNTNFLRTEFNKRIKALKLDEQAKEELFNRFSELYSNGFKCAYCNERMELKWGTELSFTIDHIIPRKLGGRDTLDNIAFTCRTCNFLKGDRQPDWFYSNIKRLKSRKKKREHFKAKKASEKDEQLREAYKDIFERVGANE